MLSRVVLVIQEASPAIDRLATLMSDTLSVHGVQTFRHHSEDPSIGSARFDLALWLPDEDGAIPELSAGAVPARIHAALCVHDEVNKERACRYDALFALHEVLVAPLARAGTEVLFAPLPVMPTENRDEAKRKRGLGSKPLVLFDLEETFDAHADRVLFQLALTKEPSEWLIITPTGRDKARARARDLAERHQVDAYLALQHDLPAAIPAVDLVVGRPSWAELVLLSAHRVPLMWLDDEGRLGSVLRALKVGGGVRFLAGVLSLAAELDGALSQGGLRTRGEVLAEGLTADAPAFLEAARHLKPRSAEGKLRWELIGPSAKKREPVVVEARDPDVPKVDRAQQIEDQLAALKDRIARSAGEQ